MPVIVCPKCQGRLRMPDQAEPRRVKCPNCGAVFMSTDADEEGGKPAAPATKPKPSIGEMAQSGMKRKRQEVEDEDDDRPRAKRRRDEDEVDDDRPRARRGRDEDENDDDRPRARRRDEDDDDRPRARRGRDEDEDDDDRPRSRRRDREEDDDYDDDRPRRRGRGRDYDDDYEDDPKAAKRRMKAQLAKADTAVMLNFIGYWLGAGSTGVVGLGLLIGLIAQSGDIIATMFMIGGILGMGSLITSTVGYGFALAGPGKNGAMGLAIATLSVAGVYILLIIIAISQGGGRGAAYFFGGGGRGDGGFLMLFNSPLPFMLALGVLLSTGFRGGFDFMMLLIPLLEIGRHIIYFLYLKSMAENVKDYRLASTCKTWIVAFSCVCGGLIVVGLLVGLIGRGGGMGRGGGETVFIIAGLLTYGALCAMSIMGAVVNGSVRKSMRYR